MKTKDKILEKINHIDDESILKELLEMIEVELNLAGGKVKLTKEQKTAIDEGLNDLEEGRSYSNEEARKIVNEWFKKR